MPFPNFYTAYERPPSVPFKDEGPSLTQQHFADSCNINKIMEKYRRTGILPINSQKAVFGDCEEGFDFLTAQRQIAAAKEAFAELPAKVRRRFDNDPAALLAFLEDPTNRLEAEALGLVEKAKPTEPPPGVPDLPPPTKKEEAAPSPT